MMLYGNKGEWGELYIFFKVLVDGKIYAADSDYNRIDNLFLTVLSLMREEKEKGKRRGKKKLKKFLYTTGEIVRIKLNGEDFMTVPRYEFEQHIKEIWSKIDEKESGSFTVIEVKEFLEKIGIGNLKSPAKKTSEFFGGTIDIVMEVITHDNIKRVLGFSCKTDLKSASTLFNASGDNTNFLYRLKGPVNDELMSEFNNIYSRRNGKNGIKFIIPTSKRMDFLKKHNISLTFERPVSDVAKENLIISGGKEMPAIVGGMLEYFYYNNSGSQTSVTEAITNIAENNVANYNMKNLQNIYHIKVANLIYNMFTGLRFKSYWNGRAEVNGGYIVLKNDGDVVAYHSTIADEFKEFLVSKLRFESPSHSRHRDMMIEKIDGEYYLKLALQLRFKLNH